MVTSAMINSMSKHGNLRRKLQTMVHTFPAFATVVTSKALEAAWVTLQTCKPTRFGLHRCCTTLGNMQ